MVKYSYANFCNATRLTAEIRESQITATLLHINTSEKPDSTDIFFQSHIAAEEVIVLNSIVSRHLKTILDTVMMESQEKDTDGAQIVRLKAAKKGWSFWAVPIEVTTSLLSNNVHCKDSNGVDVPGISYKIYNSGGIEITVPGILDANLATCTKTVIDFEPPFDYEIIGGSIRTNANIGSDVRLWIVGAPDIPVNLGGSKEFASGINLKFLAPDAAFEIDGRVTKFLTYNEITHSSRMRIILKHPAGTQINLQIIIHVFRQ